MRNIPCNTAWTRRQKRWPYWDAGSAPQQVNLPDDFVLEKPRTPTAPGEAAVGFIPDGLATYEKTFDAPKEWEGKPVFLSFDGAYMNARVTVNRELLQLHPYGYTPFAVELTPWLRFDIPNQLEVTLQGTQPSSRWYSGAGLYRQVSFWVGEPCYIDPRDLFLTTPVVERDSAQVLVEAQAQNTTSQPQEAVLEVTLSFQGQEKARASVPVTLAPGEKTPCSLTLTVDAPALWDDLEPNLYQATVSLSAPGQEPDTTTQNIGIRKIEVTAAEGDGPVNALDLALRKALLVFYPQVERMRLRDFKVRVIDSGGTASVVRVLIESTDGSHVWTTTGVSSNIIQACLAALQDSLTYFLTFVA